MVNYFHGSVYKMAKRNLWSYEETVALLSIIEEKNCISHFDGKKYRNCEIYKVIEEEMKIKGLSEKSAKQIEVRWKNLKCQYYAAKKNNNTSGAKRETCPFFEDLDRMLGCRPSSILVSGGLDTSRDSNKDDQPDKENCPTTSANCGGTESNEPAASCSQPKKKQKTSYARSIDVLSERIAKVQKEMSKNFLEEQKKLIQYEFTVHSEREKESEEKFREMMRENTNHFLSGLKSILQEQNAETDKSNNSIRNFLQSWTEDD